MTESAVEIVRRQMLCNMGLEGRDFRDVSISSFLLKPSAPTGAVDLKTLGFRSLSRKLAILSEHCPDNFCPPSLRWSFLLYRLRHFAESHRYHWTGQHRYCSSI